MADGAVISFAAPVFESDDLFVFALFHDFGRDLSGIAELTAIDMHQHLKRGRLAGFNIEKINIERIAFGNTVLPSAGLNNCVSHKVAVSGEKKAGNVSQKCGSDKNK